MNSIYIFHTFSNFTCLIFHYVLFAQLKYKYILHKITISMHLCAKLLEQGIF